MSAEQQLREDLDASFVQAEKHKNRIEQTCFNREDLPVDVAMTLHAATEIIFASLKRHRAAVGRLLDPIPDEVSEWLFSELLSVLREKPQ